MSETHKSIRFVDFDGHHMGLSNEEAMSRRLNNWKGWKCSAGRYNMHVSADGNIFAATCKVGGMLGNVYDDRFKLSDRWTTCSKEWCMCGQDMQLPKARKESFLPYVLEDPPGKEVNHLSSVDWVAPYHMESFRQYPYFITWDLGRRCNYACDYCLPSLSNTYEAHKSWGSLKHAADNIIKNFSKGSPARWIFTGGEPTINPSFMDLVKYLHEKGHNLHTQTNGSRTAEYHAELI
ncbi:MAG: radical SAM protein, partial [Bdellovibrionales bacterium]|nr:radical SAM protein [Bdellovibrionales bacterium]